MKGLKAISIAAIALIFYLLLVIGMVVFVTDNSLLWQLSNWDVAGRFCLVLFSIPSMVFLITEIADSCKEYGK